MYEHEKDIAGHSETVNCLAFSSDGAFLASGDDAGVLIVWAAPTAQEHDRYQLVHSITALCWVPNTSTLLVGFATCDVLCISVVSIWTPGSWNLHPD